MVFLSDYLVSLAEGGMPVPDAPKHAFSVCAETMGTECPIANPLVFSAASVETNARPRQAPSMGIDTLRLIGGDFHHPVDSAV